MESIGHCRLSDEGTPRADLQLTGDNCRTQLMPILDEFKEVLAIYLLLGFQAKVVKDAEIQSRQHTECFLVAAVGPCDP
jgi:hypothetical protein